MQMARRGTSRCIKKPVFSLRLNNFDSEKQQVLMQAIWGQRRKKETFCHWPSSSRFLLTVAQCKSKAKLEKYLCGSDSRARNF